MADARVTFVFADKNTGKAVKMDDEMKRSIEKLKINTEN